MSEDLKNRYLEYLTERINDFNFSDVDCFMEDNNVSDEDFNDLLKMRFKVIENCK